MAGNFREWRAGCDAVTRPCSVTTPGVTTPAQPDVVLMGRRPPGRAIKGAMPAGPTTQEARHVRLATHIEC